MKRPEEIKKGLDACISGECNSKRITCPYRKENDCTTTIIVDALAYIRELEMKLAEKEKPLVPLTLDEVKALVGVWIEDDGCWWGSYEPQPALWCGRVNGRFHRFIDKSYEDEGEFVFFEEAEYGITWRCWPRKPTDEERKAAKWDE